MARMKVIRNSSGNVLLAVFLCLLMLSTSLMIPGFTVEANEGRVFDTPSRVNPHRGSAPAVYETGQNEGESAPNNALYRLEAYSDSVSVFRKSDNTQLLNLQFTGADAFWGFSPDEHRFFIYFYDGTKHNAQLFNLEDAESNAAPVWPEPGSPDSSGWTLSESRVAFSRNGQYLFFAGLNGSQVTLRVVEAATGTVRHAQNYSGADSGWGFSPDADRFVIHYYDGTTHQVRLYNLEGSQHDTPPVWSSDLNLGGGETSAFSFSRNGDYLLYAAIEGTNHLYLWVVDAATGSESYSVDFNIGQQPGLEDDKIGSATWGFDRQANTFIYAYYNTAGQVEWQPVRLPEGEHISAESPFETAYARWRTCYYGEAIGIFSWTATQTQVRLLRVSDGASLYNTYHSGRTEDVEFRTTDDWFIALIDGVQYNLAPREGDPPEPPTWPAGSELSFSDVEPTSLTVSWPEAEDEEAVTGYRLFRDEALIATVGADVLSRSVTGLNPDSEYTFGVEAGNAEGLWTERLEGAVTTSPEPSGPPIWPAESELNFSEVGLESLTVSWPAAEDDEAVTGYRLFQDGVEIAALDGNVLSHDVEGLDPDSEYTFGVEAGNAEGLWSDRLEGNITTPSDRSFVSTPEQLQAALEDSDIETIIFENDITAHIEADRLVNLDFSGYTLTGNLSLETGELGGVLLSGSALPAVSGDMLINAPNATGTSNVRVGGETVITGIEGWVENADGNDLVTDMESGTATVYINGALNTLTVNGSGDGLMIIVNGSVQEAFFNAPATVTGEDNIVTAHIDSEDVIMQGFFAGGDGTADDPYQVACAAGLNHLSNYLGEEYANTHFILTENINLGVFPWFSQYHATAGWKPIGYWKAWNDYESFQGNVDGNGKTIRNLYIDRLEASRVGFFGFTDGATIKNIILKNVNITGGDYVGGLVGMTVGNTVIKVVNVDGSIYGINSVGGLVGQNNDSAIIDCYASVDTEGWLDVGGLVGYNVGPITSSGASGSVTGTPPWAMYIGGLAGLNSSSIERCYASGHVSGYMYVGGLVGVTEVGFIKESRAMGAVSSNNDDYGYYLGGLVGYSAIDIENCYAMGCVESSGEVQNYLIGGLLGYNDGNVTNSYAVGSVRGDDYTGGLIGACTGNWIITNSYYNYLTSNQSDVGKGSPRTTEQMTYPHEESTTYIGWDFEAIWGISPERNAGYPFLRWLDTEPEPGTYEVTFGLVANNGVLTASVDGEAIASGDEVEEGSEVIFSATPDAGWQVKDWFVDGSAIGSQEPTYTITNLQADVLVEVEFEAITVPSTYKFTYQVPAEIMESEETEIAVTFATDILGDFGYDNVRFAFSAEGSGTVTFSAEDAEGALHTFTDSGYWGPAEGFNLPADYAETTLWTLLFSEVGSYTITFSLIEAPDGEVVAGITDSVTLEVVEEDEPLEEGDFDALREKIETLVADGALNRGQGNALLATLWAAERSNDRGNAHTASNNIAAFINQVNAFMRGGNLGESDGQELISLAEDLMEQL